MCSSQSKLRTVGRQRRSTTSTRLRHETLPPLSTSSGPAGDVFELACGPAVWTQQLLRHAATVTGLDAAPEMMARPEHGSAAAVFGLSRRAFSQDTRGQV